MRGRAAEPSRMIAHVSKSEHEYQRAICGGLDLVRQGFTVGGCDGDGL